MTFLKTGILLLAMASGINTFTQSSLDTLKGDKVLALLKQDHYSEAFKVLKEIQDQYKHTAPERDYVRLLLDISYIFDERGNYQSSLEYAFAALNLSSNRAGLEWEKSKALLEIASTYFFLADPVTGLEYVRQGLIIARQLKDYDLIAQGLNSTGTLSDKLGEDSKALSCYDSALILRKKIKDFRGISATLSNIGLLYEKRGQFEKALSYQLKSLSIDDSLKNMYGVSWSYQMLGTLELKMKDHKAAEYYLAKADSIASILNSNGVLIEIYRNKKELLKQQGQYKEALHYADLFEKLKDSVYSRELMGSVSALQSTFEINRKDQELKEQENTLRQQRNFIIVVASTLVLVGILAFFYYRSFSNVRKLNREIAEQSEEIQAQAEELTESNQTIYQINQHLEEAINARTSELIQAYKELDTFFYRASHDFRRPLTTFMGLAEVAKITVKDEYILGLFDKVRQTANNLDKMLLKLQSISDVGLQHLSSKEIFIKDIFDSVFTTFYDSLREEEMKLNVEVLNKNSFHSYPSLLKVILENLVENSIHFKRQGNDRYVNLKAYELEDEIVLEVKDNGQGIEEQYQDRIFDMYFRGSERSKGNGLGLYIVKKAVEKLNGRIIFQSKYDEGSVFSVFLPKDLA